MSTVDGTELNSSDRALPLHLRRFIWPFKPSFTTQWNGSTWPHATRTWEAATAYVEALLSPGDDKHMRGLSDRMATSEDCLQQFITDSPWDHDLVQADLNHDLPPSYARIQVRTRRNALRLREPARNDQRVCVVWCFDRETAVGS